LIRKHPAQPWLWTVYRLDLEWSFYEPIPYLQGGEPHSGDEWITYVGADTLSEAKCTVDAFIAHQEAGCT
jgi:hypothetical protein